MRYPLFTVVVMALGLGLLPALAQVTTEVPPAVAGARPVSLERIKVDGPALSGNL